MLPTISIVVTCYNYGHFLGACLASLTEQTRPADQIIVVDDGSTDNSRAIARAWTEDLTLIEQENGGQASAFNAGFACATGDVVLFLDADDTLARDALELISHAWHDGLSAINFRLNLIDAAGRPSGSYAAEPADGDKRPELLAYGDFEFMPTSGNAFNRLLIAPAFPLPVARWRVSADTVLVRVAALAGPMRQLPFALGNYRAHGGNAYHRTVIPRLQSWQRAIRDMADACLTVATLPPAKPVFGDDPDAVRLGLVLVSLRKRFSLPRVGDHRPQRLRAVQSALKVLLRLGIGLRAKAVCALCLAFLPFIAGIVPKVELWMALPAERPRFLSKAIGWALGSRLVARRRKVHRSRWLETAGAGQLNVPGGYATSYFNTFDWRPREGDRVRVLCSGTGEILLPIDHFPNGVRLDLDVRSIPPFDQMPVELSVSTDEQLLGKTLVLDEGRLSLVVEQKATLLGDPLRLALSAVPRPRSIGQRWTSLVGPSALVEVAGLAIEPLPEAKTGVMLSLGEHRSFHEIARACQVSPPADADLGWPDSIDAQELVLAFVKPSLADAAELVIRFSNEQVRGSVVVTDSVAPVYRGSIGPSAVIHIPIAPRRFAQDRDLTLRVSLDPDDPFSAPVFRLVSIGLASPGSPLAAAAPEQVPMIEPGQVWRLEEDGMTAADCLAEGWTRTEEGAESFDTLGVLRFAVSPETSTDAVLHLLLAPAASLPDDTVLAVAVSIGAMPVGQVILNGEHELAVPLGEALAEYGRRIEIAIHAALSQVGDDSEAGVQLARGGLLLKSVRLSSSPLQMSDLSALPLPFFGHTLTSNIEAAADQARELCARICPANSADIAEFAAQRAGVETAIRRLASNSVLPILLNEEALDNLSTLGEAVRQAGEDSEIRHSGGEFDAMFWADPVEATRVAAVAMVSVPPWQALAGHLPDELSPVLCAFPSRLARYLCSAGHRVDPAAYSSYLQTLLGYARDSFVRESNGSRHARLVDELLRQITLDPLIGEPGSLRDAARALGAAIEACLVRRGRRITLSHAPGNRSGRPRLGIFLRNLRDGPESQLLRATFAALADDEFDIVVFAVETGADAIAHLPRLEPIILDGVATDRAVETMRAAGLDIFLNFASFHSYDEVAAILAHRVAPVAVAATVSPAVLTTGLRSFDVMVTPSPDRPDLVAGPERMVRFVRRNAAAAARGAVLDGAEISAFGNFLAGVIVELASGNRTLDAAARRHAVDTNGEQARNTNHDRPRHN